MNYTVYLTIVVIAISCISNRSDRLDYDTRQFTDQLLISAIGQSNIFSKYDTINLYNYYGINDDLTESYHREVNIAFQYYLLDTLHLTSAGFTGKRDDRTKSWKWIQRYAQQLRGQQAIRIPKTLLRKTVVLFDSKVSYLKSGNKDLLFQVGIGSELADKTFGLTVLLIADRDQKYNFVFEGVGDSILLTEERFELLESNSFVYLDWIRTINFDQSYYSFLKNDHLRYIDTIDKLALKECLELLGGDCNYVSRKAKYE